MSKFEWKGDSIKTLKFEDKVGTQSKCWNLSANGQIDQNVKKFEWKGNNQWKCWNLSEKEEVQQMFMFYCKSGNRSKLLEFEN